MPSLGRATEGWLRVPETLTPIDPNDGPLQRFAFDLRRLRDQAPRRTWSFQPHPAGPKHPVSTWDIDDVMDVKIGPSRATVYGALSGKRMPRADTLRDLVEAWSGHLPEPQRREAVAAWLARRQDVLSQLASSPRRTPPKPKVPVTEEQEQLARELRELAAWLPVAAASAQHALRLASNRSVSRGHLNEILAGRSVPTDGFLDDLFLALRGPRCDEARCDEPSKDQDWYRWITTAEERIRTLAAKARSAKRSAAARARAAAPGR